MKILLFKKSIAVIALVMLLSLSAVASMTILANAVPEKDPNVFVSGEGSVKLTWKSGESNTYSSCETYAKFGGLDTVTIIPDYGWIRIATVEIDGIPKVGDEDGFTLIDVQAKKSILARFEENLGVDEVDEGSNVKAYPYSDVYIIFGEVSGAGEAHAYAIEWAQYPLQIWDMHTTAYFTGAEVILEFSYTEVIEADLVPINLKLWRTDSVSIVRADVNEDGVVNGTDVSIVANANPSDPNLRLDQNGDGKINNEDVNIVNNYIGETVWEKLVTVVYVDEPNDLVRVTGETDHFSIFGAH